jgi:hypothetical protein
MPTVDETWNDRTTRQPGNTGHPKNTQGKIFCRTKSQRNIGQQGRGKDQSDRPENSADDRGGQVYSEGFVGLPLFRKFISVEGRHDGFPGPRNSEEDGGDATCVRPDTIESR